VYPRLETTDDCHGQMHCAAIKLTRQSYHEGWFLSLPFQQVGCARSVRRDRTRSSLGSPKGPPSDYEAHAVAQDPAIHSGTIHKKLVLGSAQPKPPERTGQLSIRRSKEDRPTRTTREESAPLPHSASHPVRNGHSPATRGRLPSPPRFWNGPKPTSRPKAVRARLKVAKRTTADATGSSRFTLNGFTYSFQEIAV
jgi:hypothetical protein